MSSYSRTLTPLDHLRQIYKNNPRSIPEDEIIRVICQIEQLCQTMIDHFNKRMDNYGVSKGGYLLNIVFRI